MTLAIMNNTETVIDHFIRDDGYTFSRNHDGTFSMDESMMARPYRYTAEKLLECQPTIKPIYKTKNMSIHDETWDKSLRKDEAPYSNPVPNEIALPTSGVVKAHTAHLKPKDQAEIMMENLMSFYRALEDAGAAPSLVMEDHMEFFRILATNNISIKASYDGKR